ncbi:LrgB family protein [Rhizobium laguerreae]|uniref:LrgB family protein n=1 Tax=Rhizobium laguerreae TaxID=1076926 RepID=UPI001C903FAB|nr:LrgB family protein [Rhizobium laguerreae]MBY3073948.1 LrgB family protein [Rhizobium laguerreae]MBY3101950.1 LrgB family protein [Rhizobium laguerreae]MBY3142555.1 LrgB family protein [Rhizobium laguerreae]MBY3164986.1 LrgB family protein [Rhizobium laguerreae]MBY3204990.1 LrgB family protein [Rhizobium laguerreae]
MDEGLWVYLSASPLLWLSVTLLVWITALRIANVLPANPLINPVLLSVSAIACLLSVFHVRYQTYFAGAQFIHFLLGPATVALGIPLYEKLHLVRANLIPMVVALFAGSLTAVTTTIYLCHVFGFDQTVIASLAPKSVTAAVAMAISSGLHGDPALTAAVVILTGISGAIIVTPLMNAMKIRDYSARGFAVGLASHGIGTARAYSVDPVAGLFSGLAMGLNAIVTSLIVHLFL